MGFSNVAGVPPINKPSNWGVTNSPINDNGGGGGGGGGGLAGVTFWLRATPSGFADRKGSVISSSGGVSLSTISKFGNSIQMVNGSISIPDSNSLIPPTGDWTIDLWYRHISGSLYGGLFMLDGSDFPLGIYQANALGSNLIAAVGTNTSWYENSISIGTPSTTQSDYYGLKRDGNTISAWKNGIQTSAFTVSSSLAIGVPTSDAIIGNNSGFYCSGYYEEFRISSFARDLSIVPTALDP